MTLVPLALAPRVALATALVLFAVSPAFAWSNKEHIQLTRLAAMRLLADPGTPPEMKAWLRDATPGVTDMAGERDYFMRARVGQFPRGVDGITFWVTVPDLHAGADIPGAKGKAVAPFGVGERLLHFIDLEHFMPDESKRRYADDLSHKPTLADVPRDMADPRFKRAGMLPFRVEQCYRSLVEQLRAGRLDDRPGQFPRDEHAARWAGYLAHYVQDNTQPQHATEDYKSGTYFNNRVGSPNVHADVEYRLPDDEFDDYEPLRAEFWELFVKALDAAEDPVQPGDLFRETLEVSLASYDALPLIGRAAVAAYKADEAGGKPAFNAETFYRFKGTVGGAETTVMEMKARQLAWAVVRVEAVWRRAWDEATGGKPEDENEAAN